MHIPDGYLSPSSCAIAYAAALPFWAVSLRRLKRTLQGRLVPLLAVVSAFCFVVMMFNLPIPGGSTAHAVGMGVAAILLGPFAGLMAISIALAIQALFFGDGGITAFGANAFNMAIVGTFVAYAVYRLAAAGAATTSRRRVVAAGLAGYAAINASAFLAACEFGVQPMLFHDAAGTPLYAPYPLSIAVPAMMLAHLTVAGAAEAILTAGVVAWIQRSSPDLLERSPKTWKPAGAGNRATPGFATPFAAGTRRLWAGVGALMVLSPVGLWATGMAWGEWSAADFADGAARAAMAHASGGAAPPPVAPEGLQRLAGIWTAPMPGYAPAFMHEPAFGYVLSAFTGAGLVVLASALLSRLLARPARTTGA